MNKKTFFSVLALLIIFTFLAINLDLYPYRQILGGVIYSFFFGFLFLSIFGVKEINIAKQILYALGLSISFLMFFGYIMDQLYYLFGYTTPLSTTSLSFSLTLVLLAMIVLLYSKERTDWQFTRLKFNLTPIEKVLISVSILLPALSIYGMWNMNTMNDNLYIMILYFVIVFLVVLIASLTKRIPERLYPFLIYFIGLSLVLPFAMRSNYIMGDDVHHSFYLFKNIFAHSHWSILEHGPLSACLSITLLPAIYKSLLGINNQYIFKLLYSLLFSFAPIVIYELSRKYVEALYAFLASFLFMSQQNFLWALYEARTITAIFFFALSILAIFDSQVDIIRKKVLFLIFLFTVIVSHYTTTYIYFFILIVVVTVSYIFSNKFRSQIESPTNRNISLLTPILFFAALFLWFGQATKSGFECGVRFASCTLSELNQMLSMEVRSETVQCVFGGGIMEKDVPHKIEFILSWIILIMIAIGFFYLIIKFIETVFNSKKNSGTFLLSEMSIEYLALILACISLLFIFVAAPYISEGYGMMRAYCQTSVILSMVSIIGMIAISERIKLKPVLLILIITLPYFLCVTGVIYQLFDYPRQPVLNSEGNFYLTFYIHDTEYTSGQWYSLYSPNNIKIYTDTAGAKITSIIGSRIRSGSVTRTEEYIPYYQNIRSFSKDGFEDLEGYIYLRYVNVVDKKFAAGKLKYKDFSGNYTMLQTNSDKIYANGGSEVYFTQRL